MQNLINHDDLRFVNRSRAARLYVDNKPKLTDPIIDKLHIIAIPKSDNHDFQVGQKLTAFSEYSKTIFQNRVFTIFSNVDMDLLNEYRHINTNKYDYFAVIFDYSIH